MDRRERFAGSQDAISSALAGWQSGLWTALPGEVVSYDPDALTVVVQPTIKGVIQTPSGEAVAQDLPVLPDVPVFFPRGGGLTLTFPIKPGDECVVVFSSRCIDGWWQSGGSQLAPEFRMHDLSDGFAFIGPQSQPRKIPAPSTNAAQLRTDDGSYFLELTPDGTINGTAVEWNLKGPVNIDGRVNITGRLDVGGVIKSLADVVARTVSLLTHKHPGDGSGSGNTGNPIQ